jgi:hypothetical protein
VLYQLSYLAGTTILAFLRGLSDCGGLLVRPEVLGDWLAWRGREMEGEAFRIFYSSVGPDER